MRSILSRLERRRRSRVLGMAVLSPRVGLTRASTGAGHGSGDAEWKTYGADLASTRYSPLDQINKDNFSKLKIAWRLTTNDFGPRPDTLYSATPLFVGNVLYTTVGTARTVVALNPTTGAVLWKHVEDEGPRGQNAARSGAGRGVAYWSSAERIGSAHHLRDARLPDARARREDRRATVDIRARRRRRLEARRRSGSRSRHRRYRPERHAARCRRRDRRRRRAPLQRIAEDDEQRARVRARIRREDRQASLDLSHGAQAWRVRIRHVARRERRSQRQHRRMGAVQRRPRARSRLRARRDADRRLLRRQPAGQYAVRRESRRARYQDRQAQVALPDRRITASGTTTRRARPCSTTSSSTAGAVRALAQPTKQAFLFVLNRETGEPIWPIEERPVPQSTVPNERTSPTQPFPTKPLPFDRQGVSVDDLIDFTPALRAEALEVDQAVHDRSALHAAGVQQRRRPARHDPAAGRYGRRQLAGRVIRSGNQPPVTFIRTRPHTSPASFQPIPPRPTSATSPARRAREAQGRAARRRRPRIPMRHRPLRGTGRARGPAVRLRAAAAARRCKACRSSSRRTTASRRTT